MKELNAGKTLYEKKNSWQESVVKILVVTSLLCSFTNYVFISAIAVLAVLFILPLLDKNGFCISEFTFVLLLLFLFYFVSALIIQPEQVISFDFYRRDGNFFITFFPLLVLSVCSIKFDIWRILNVFVIVSTIGNVVGLIRFFLGGTPEYFMLFTAHNAAGGFLAMLSIVNFFVAIRHKDGLTSLFFLFCFAINVFGLYLTNSRGSLLPLIIAVLVYACMRFNDKIDIWVISLIFIAILIFVGLIVYVRGAHVIVELEGFKVPKEYYSNGFYRFIFSILNRSWTMISRLFYLWPRAFYLFLQSPILGIGFGGYNDTDYNLVGIKGVWTINFSPEMINSDAHAHNTYFHLLAETGIIGFILFVFLVIAMRNKIFKEKDKGLKWMLFIMLVFALGSSFFEHRFYTPSQMIPFILILGMVISNQNYQKRYGLEKLKTKTKRK